MQVNPGEPAILIIDDEGSIVEVIQRALHKEGYAAAAVQNASQALELLSTTSFDLILCDLQIPGMHGVELYQKLVHAEPEMEGRFIFMTGEMLNPSRQSFIMDNRIPVLLKPFDLIELYQAVEQTLQGD